MIAETGMTVYWKDGLRTTFNLLGDLQAARFPNTDEGFQDPKTGGYVPGFFDWFGKNWATPPADGRLGVRQSLIVDAETISNNVGRLLELMRDGVDMNGKPIPGPSNEWGVPPGPITPLMMHAAAATRFPSGWQASPERAKYMLGSLVTDRQRPGPTPTVNTELEALRSTLAAATREIEALGSRLVESEKNLDSAVKKVLSLEDRQRVLLSELDARAKGMRKAAGTTPKGQYQQALLKAAIALEKSVAEYREKAGA